MTELLNELRNNRLLWLLVWSAAHDDHRGHQWPIGVALATLAGVTVMVALVSEFSSNRCRKRPTLYLLPPAAQ